MGKHEPMTAKAIANRIKAKGLQKIKYYCEMCKKQCRDDNGFKCHIMSEAHQRQALIVCENPDAFVGEYSQQFMDGFMYILKTRYRSKRILANAVFQDYIKDREHIHLNGTRWTSLTEFANWLGEKGLVRVDESERGVMITYIDRDPETLRRQELEAKRAQLAKEAAIKEQEEIARQMELTKKLYADMEQPKPALEPVPIVKVIAEPVPGSSEDNTNKIMLDQKEKGATSCDRVDISNEDTSSTSVVERPLFGVTTMSVKTTQRSSYKPPPKRKLVKRSNPDKKAKIK